MNAGLQVHSQGKIPSRKGGVKKLIPGCSCRAYDAAMDQSRPSQQHRLTRSALRASLWLAKLQTVLPAFERFAPAAARAWLNRRLNLLADFVISLIFIRAAHARTYAPPLRNGKQIALKQGRHDVRANVRHDMRGALGGALRRAVKPRGSFKVRAEAILYALRNQAKLAAQLCRRTRLGLSRRASAFSRVKDAACATPQAPMNARMIAAPLEGSAHAPAAPP